MHAVGIRFAIDLVRRPRLAGDLLYDREGALADERDRHRIGAHAVAATPAHSHALRTEGRAFAWLARVCGSRQRTASAVPETKV